MKKQETNTDSTWSKRAERRSTKDVNMAAVGKLMAKEQEVAVRKEKQDADNQG